MKTRLTALLLIIGLLFSLAACVEAGNTPSSAAVTTAPTQTTTVPSTISEDAIYDAYYAGKPEELMVTYKDYDYIHWLPRNLQWEKDIVYLARTLLETHPVLKDGYRHTKMKDGEFVWLNSNEYYDGQLRRAIIEAVDQLLGRITQLEDYEITMEMRRIVAMVSDVHTWLMATPEAVLPVSVEQIEKDGQVGLYVVRAPREQPELLLCQLTAINGRTVEEIIQLLKPYVSWENEYGLTAEIVEPTSMSTLINSFDALCVVGVADWQTQGATLTFVDHDGVEFTVTLETVSAAKAYLGSVKIDYYSNRIGLHARPELGNYWYEVWPEENAVYFRIASCVDMEDYSMSACCMDVLAALESAQEPMRLIIDLRHNGGGYYPLDGVLELTLAIEEMELDGIYILIDSQCYSATTYYTLEFDQCLEDAVLIGTPLGQPFGFFAGAGYFPLINGDLAVRISTMYSNRWPDFTGTTFMPDILLYPNWEDYQNGIDTVLNTALTMD